MFQAIHSYTGLILKIMVFMRTALAVLDFVFTLKVRLFFKKQGRGDLEGRRADFRTASLEKERQNLKQRILYP